VTSTRYLLMAKMKPETVSKTPIIKAKNITKSKFSVRDLVPIKSNARSKAMANSPNPKMKMNPPSEIVKRSLTFILDISTSIILRKRRVDIKILDNHIRMKRR